MPHLDQMLLYKCILAEDKNSGLSNGKPFTEYISAFDVTTYINEAIRLSRYRHIFIY